MSPRTPHLTRTLLALVLTAPAAVAAAEYPDPVQQLIDRGAVEVVGEFEAPGGLTGYAGEMRGQPVALYLTEDGQHVLVGTLLDARGRNLTAPELEQRVTAPKFADVWPQLEDSHWVQDGADDADTVIYTLTDPNCPYCYKLRDAAAPWIEAGRVQLRHIVVGILAEDSPAKAATILGSEDPAAALQENYRRFDAGGVSVASAAVESGRAALEDNTRLMQELGLRATPTTFYRDDGAVAIRRGLPERHELPVIMGSPRPQ
ncbi:MAG: thiol:disulfide interchange protein DsbG [Pseudomonadota bacterium]